MKGLTARQREVLAYLHGQILHGGYPPTLRELADKFGVTRSAALGYLTALERKGYIRRERRVARGIRLVQSSEVL